LTETSARGKVYIVGAGPGDPDLLTVKAHALLKSAEVILHDDLVPASVLSVASAEATILNVGKRCGAKKITQEEINALMIETARLGFCVIRLKSGDPSLFGRLAEELDALDAAGIPCEIVPGITAALGAAASARVSLTDRRTSSRVVFLTAHHSGGLEAVSSDEWKDVARKDSTLVIYMPGNELRSLGEGLLRAGLSGHTPVLIVSRASTPQQREFATILRNLDSAPSLAAPAVLFVGRTFARVRSSAESRPSAPAVNNSLDKDPRPRVAGQSRSLASDSFAV